MLRMTIQRADYRYQMADIGSSETADPYNVILNEVKNLNYELRITNYEL